MSFFRYLDYINCHMSLPTRLFICCDSDLFVPRQRTTEKFTPRNVDAMAMAREDENESHDGDEPDDCDGDLSDTVKVESNGSHLSWFTVSAEGEAFLEATFNSRLNYKDRRKQIAKYSEPDSKWTTCPSISPVVAVTLPPAAIKDGKVAFWSQEMYMEVIAPLAALLENTDKFWQRTKFGKLANRHEIAKFKFCQYYFHTTILVTLQSRLLLVLP